MNTFQLLDHLVHDVLMVDDFGFQPVDQDLPESPKLVIGGELHDERVSLLGLWYGGECRPKLDLCEIFGVRLSMSHLGNFHLDSGMSGRELDLLLGLVVLYACFRAVLYLSLSLFCFFFIFSTVF